jgi:hypothetical protein
MRRASCTEVDVPRVSYLLPFRSHKLPSEEFTDYVNRLSAYAEVLLIDASPSSIFNAVGARCVDAVRHLAPDAHLASLVNGKVRGVLTGVRLASHEAVVIADDDVRHTRETLDALSRLLGEYDIVRPQNYFDPLPWHARLDTGRILINRMTGGDWPGTLAVRRSTLLKAGGYDGNVLFENLELVRTIEAIGGRSLSAPDLFVQRLPPAPPHFCGQRVRQAYDEFARPARLIAALSILPLLVGASAAGRGIAAVTTLAGGAVVIAAAGRQRNGGSRFFPASTALWAPLWVCERAITSWLALGTRLLRGGVAYHGEIVRRAAHSRRALQHRSSRA